MKKDRKATHRFFVPMFLIFVLGLGAVSFFKFETFLITGKADYNEWNAQLGSKTETKFASNFFKKFSFINLNGFMRRVLRQREMNGVIKLNNGYLLTSIEYVDDEKLKSYAQNIKRAKDWLSDMHIEFIYAITPYTESKFDPQLPQGFEDFGNDDLDRLCHFLSESGIDTVDFRQELHDDGIDQYKMMYRTDHHWNTEMGFYAYCTLSSIIEEKLCIKIDPMLTDISNYTISTYKNWHLGSRGQRTGAFFAGMDDFDLITPKFETAIKQDGEVGSFESKIVDYEPLKTKNPMSRYTYDSVLGRSLARFENVNSGNDKRIFLVTDSMGKAVAPFLILSCKEFGANWGTFDCEEIERFKPDIVIFLQYGQNAALSGINFAFQ